MLLVFRVLIATATKLHFCVPKTVCCKGFGDLRIDKASQRFPVKPGICCIPLKDFGIFQWGKSRHYTSFRHTSSHAREKQGEGK